MTDPTRTPWITAVREITTATDLAEFINRYARDHRRAVHVVDRETGQRFVVARTLVMDVDGERWLEIQLGREDSE